MHAAMVVLAVVDRMCLSVHSATAWSRVYVCAKSTKKTLGNALCEAWLSI